LNFRFLLLILSVLSASCVEYAIALEIRWLGVAGLSISDRESTILIDPVFTKPSLNHWFFNSKFRSDPERVRVGLQRAEVRNAKAIFASHCHFDHVVDVARVSEITGAPIHGGVSLQRIASGDPGIHSKFVEIEDRKPVQVGRFKVIPYRREHPPILHLRALKFLPGEVPAGFEFNFYDYHEGEVWGFRVEHPEGNLLVDQSSHFFDRNLEYAGKTDAYFVGVANKESLDALVEGNILRVRSPLVVPMHFDFFLLQSDFLESRSMPGMDLELIRKRLGELSPGTSFLKPFPNRVIQVTKSPATGI
jgi:L-ascorbate metabolism protein UlaG (beta-lactamase superfamily)